MDTDNILERLNHLDAAIKGKVEGGWWVIADAKKAIAEQVAEINRLRLTLQGISRMAIANIEKPIPDDATD